MKRPLAEVFLITILVLMPSVPWGADFRSLLELKENGTIDWHDGVVEAKGIGVPASYPFYGESYVLGQEIISEALNISRHNLLETIVNIRINSDHRVIDIVENYPSVMLQLKEMVRQAQEVENLRKFLSDGSIEIWSRMHLHGGFSQLILPPEIRQIEPLKQVTSTKNPKASRKHLPFSEIFTGLVVDSTGLRAMPVMAPRILDEDLEEVFGPAYASREFAVQWGMVSYAIDVRDAEDNPRISENPLIVKALKTSSPGNCDLIISNADAAKLRRSSEHLVFLKECRVVIVIDPL